MGEWHGGWERTGEGAFLLLLLLPLNGEWVIEYD